MSGNSAQHFEQFLWNWDAHFLLVAMEIVTTFLKCNGKLERTTQMFGNLLIQTVKELRKISYSTV